MAFTPIIGVEVHVELLTASKMFCACRNEFGGEANSRCCPVCVGLPGSLPAPNRHAVKLTIRTGLALNCRVWERARFYRKNYFYPDLAKNYQISQYDEPLTSDGYMDLEVEGERVRIGISRAHLEEDTGKNIHLPDGRSLVDYNRCGVPLMEVVTEPDFRTAAQVREYLLQLRRLLRYLGVSTANMEEGAMRAEANVNYVDFDTGEKTPVIEVKNVASISNCHDAIVYEIERQKRELEAGTLPPHRETRRWDDTRGITSPMRRKESADDYMYFPEPDLAPMAPEPEWVEEIRAELPELPVARYARFMEHYGLSDYDAGVLCESRPLGDYFEEVARFCDDPKGACNWVMGSVTATLNERGVDIGEFAIPAGHIAELIAAVNAGTISNTIAKDVYARMLETGRTPDDIIRSEGLTQISDAGELAEIIRQAIEANPRAVEDYRAGKQKALGAMVGFVMRATKGQANPQMVNEMLREALASPPSADTAPADLATPTVATALQRLGLAAQLLEWAAAAAAKEGATSVDGRSALSRAYYACHHAIRALALHRKDPEPHKHGATIDYLVRVMSGETALEHALGDAEQVRGRLFRLYDERVHADYRPDEEVAALEPAFDFTQAATEAVSLADSLVQAVRGMITGKAGVAS